MKSIMKILYVILLVGLLSACGPIRMAADNLPWVGAQPVLFKDDFTKEKGGWTTSGDSLSFSGYENGKFRLWLNVPDYQIWSVPGLNFQNTHISTRTEKIGGPDNNFFGVLCRYQNASNYYSFVISSDGYFGVYKVFGGEKSLINQESMDFSPAINRGEAANDIEVICHENKLEFIVNGEQLIRMQDNSLSHGDVGMIAGNLDEPGAEILFDYFIVIKP